MKGILFRPDVWTAKKRVLDQCGEAVTRRLGGLKEINKSPDDWTYNGWANSWQGFAFNNIPQPYMVRIVKPRYQVGDIVYLKEGIHRFNFEYASYDIDFTPVMFHLSANRFHWRWVKDKLSPMFLPHEAARHFLQITGVRAERLQEIENHPDDYVKEGYVPLIGGLSAIDGKPFEMSMDFAWYENLWDSINGEGDYSKNKWVWVYSLKLVPRPDEAVK